MLDVFPCDSLYPRIRDDVLRIVDSKKSQVKVARVESGGGKDARENNSGIELP